MDDDHVRFSVQNGHYDATCRITGPDPDATDETLRTWRMSIRVEPSFLPVDSKDLIMAYLELTPSGAPLITRRATVLRMHGAMFDHAEEWVEYLTARVQAMIDDLKGIDLDTDDVMFRI